jgi:hypothetical protein
MTRLISDIVTAHYGIRRIAVKLPMGLLRAAHEVFKIDPQIWTIE